ncbi:MAG: helix-turn-helix domain-containing protein, partial [Bryobacteraceae bacterium]
TKRRGRKHSEAGASVIRGLNEAISWAKGEPIDAKQHTVHVPIVDPKEIRRSMRLSQAEFALKYGFSLATVRNWEQGRRTPELPAKILLAVIAKHPEIVEEVLTG